MIADALLNFTLPSLPDPLTGLHALLAAGCAALGAALVLRGLRLSRWMMMIAGAAVGLILAGTLSTRMQNISTVAVCIVLAGTLAIVAFITARVWMGMLAGALVGSGTVGWMLCANDPQLQPPDMPPMHLPNTTNLAVWASEFYGHAWQYLVALAENHMWPPLIAVGLAVVIPIGLALMARKVLTIVTTSVVGAAMVLAGAVVVAAFANTVADPRAAILSRGGLIAACCIAGAGVIFQIMTTYFKRDIPTAKPDDNSS